ncbi:hypothetical protein [Bacillus sp. V59.32b]|uniref:hypothetical protein n=1 Tax=Bacillus sp. V59.32b TaxID=1758642 RepID=UPI001359E3A2|nr:hypothetical protein [Bacillus sp. V59.32b]
MNKLIHFNNGTFLENGKYGQLFPFALEQAAETYYILSLALLISVLFSAIIAYLSFIFLKNRVGIIHKIVTVLESIPDIFTIALLPILIIYPGAAVDGPSGSIKIILWWNQGRGRHSELDFQRMVWLDRFFLSIFTGVPMDSVDAYHFLRFDKHCFSVDFGIDQENPGDTKPDDQVSHNLPCLCHNLRFSSEAGFYYHFICHTPLNLSNLYHNYVLGITYL